MVVTRSVAARRQRRALLAQRRRRASLAHAPPLDMAVEIARRVAATSPRPIADLRSLCDSCRVMREACSDHSVWKNVALEREVWDMRWSGRFLAVVNTLSAVGNPGAWFLTRIELIFGRRAHAGNKLFKKAAAAGHRLAAYVLALLLHRAGGACDDARRLLRVVEGEGEAVATGGGRGCKTTATRLSNAGCVRCRTEAVEVVWHATWRIADLPASNMPVVEAAPPEDGGHQCTGSDCGKLGWCDADAVFCSEVCRIKKECTAFFSQVPANSI